MVKGLVQNDWQDVALRELVSRTFVLNFRGAKAALDVELSSCDMESPWRILWALYGDYGLKPDDIEMTCDGLAGDFAHVRWSAYETKDPYSDVVVHEAAHLLHYLKPRNFGLHVRRHQERFVDIESAIASYSRMHARLMPVWFSTASANRGSRSPRRCGRRLLIPTSEIEEVAALVLEAARSRNGWRIIREATVIHRIRKRAKAVS